MKYAEKGEWVTCENGHRICRLARDVKKTDNQSVKDDFWDWQQPEPEVGTRAPIRCEECGAPWFAGDGVYHFPDGWRWQGQKIKSSDELLDIWAELK